MYILVLCTLCPALLCPCPCSALALALPLLCPCSAPALLCSALALPLPLSQCSDETEYDDLPRQARDSALPCSAMIDSDWTGLDAFPFPSITTVRATEQLSNAEKGSDDESRGLLALLLPCACHVICTDVVDQESTAEGGGAEGGGGGGSTRPRVSPRLPPEGSSSSSAAPPRRRRGGSGGGKEEDNFTMPFYTINYRFTKTGSGQT